MCAHMWGRALYEEHYGRSTEHWGWSTRGGALGEDHGLLGVELSDYWGWSSRGGAWSTEASINGSTVELVGLLMT